MSSITSGQATFATSHIQLIIDNALAGYAKITGINLFNSPFAAALEQSDSPEAILQLLQEREKEFNEYRDDNGRLLNCLRPSVKVLQAFSGILGGATNPIPFQPASTLFAGIDALLAAASGVASSYDALLDLFECLGNFLKRLEIYTTIPPTQIMIDIIIKIMVELLSVLALATKQMKQGRFKKFAKKLLGETEIETALQRLDRLTQDEARMTVTQSLGVIYGLVGNMKVVMEDGKASSDNIRQNLVALHQVLNEINKMKRDQLRCDAQQWLSPPDPSTNHNFVWKARYKGTAAWFFESNASAKWKARELLLWIHGKPGAGKSTLISAIIQDIEGMEAAGLATMAYYYFDFRDVKKQNCYGLLTSLISQLSTKSDFCFNVLSRLYLDYNRGIQKPNIDVLKTCLTDMLSLPGQAPIYIIVDAIDECPNFPGRPSARDEVLDLIKELVDSKLPNVHLCAASRPEMDIRMMLEPVKSLNICLHDENGQKKDIIEYIKSVVHSDRSMQRWKEDDKKHVINTLSEKADGMFRWVVCQADGLCRSFPASIRKVLNDLPKSLDETYERTLLGIDGAKREYAQRLFRCLMVSIRPLRVEELAEILAVRFDEASHPTFNADWRPENAEEAVISACSSLVAIVDRKGHQVVQFSHFSVKEYLTSERLATAEEHLSYYHILPEPAHTVLAHACLSVLLQLDDKVDRNTIGHFPLALYAARHWVDHAMFRNVSSHIQEVMECLFSPERPHFSTWVWLHDVDRDWMEPMSTIHPTRPEPAPLYYASLCGFRGLVEHLITTYSLDVNSRGGCRATPLHAASIKRHLEVASLLLEHGADPNSRDNAILAPLHWLSQSGDVMIKSTLEIVRLFVKSGANMNITDGEGRTPLHVAAQGGNFDLLKLLLESDASLDARDNNQERPLHVSCRYGKLDISSLFLDKKSDINSRDENGFIPLHTASRFGHLDVARLLLGRGSDVNDRDTQGCTPLHHASQYGHLGLARLLIDQSADVNARTADRSTPMHLASSNGHLDIAKLLVDGGANVDTRNDKEESPLDSAAGNGCLDIALFLIESGAAVSARDSEGWTPLHKASFSGHLHIARVLLDRGINVDIRNGSEQTPLYLASSSGQLDVARFLIEYGADIHAKDDKGWNALHISSQNGHLEVVRTLMNFKIAVDIRNGTQATPLALASSGGKVEVGRLLIERGADINMQDDNGWAPLHFASENGHIDMARLLLDRGVDANIQRDETSSPLLLASGNGHLKIVELLIERGAVIDVFNEKRETPLYLAVWNGKVAAARLLMDHGANLHIADSNGSTLLHVASERGHLGLVKLLLCRGADINVFNEAKFTAVDLAVLNDKGEVAKFIVQYKAYADIRNKIRWTTSDTAQYGADEDGNDEKKTSLHDAANEGDMAVVKSLLERGADVNSRNANKQTPLVMATWQGKLDVVRLLIERGAVVNSRDKCGWTALHYASRYGHLEVSRVLIDSGANVNAKQQTHRTPLHLSAGHGHLENAKLLLERGADVHVVNSNSQTPYQESLETGHQNIADLLRQHVMDSTRP